MLSCRRSLVLSFRALLVCVAGVVGCCGITACSDDQNSKIDELSSEGYAFSVADFHRAAAAGDVDALEWFVAAGMSVDVADANGGSALVNAAMAGKGDAVAFLIDQGADVGTVVGDDGRDLLMMSADAGNDDVVQVLLARNVCDPTARDNKGYHALGLATVGQHGEVVDLLARRANRDMLDDALLFSAVLGDVKTADLLLARGASVLARDANHRTPLMHAARRGHLEMVRLLMDNGANRYAIDGDARMTAGEMASATYQHAVDQKMPEHRLGGLREVKTLLTSDPQQVGAEVSGTLIDQREVVTVGEDGTLPYVETPELHDRIRVGERLDGALISYGATGAVSAAAPGVVVEPHADGPENFPATDGTAVLADELSMIEYRTKPLPVMVEGVPDQTTANLRLLYGHQRVVRVREGDCIDSLPLVVVDVKRKFGHSKDANDGELADMSTVQVRNLEDGEIYDLTTGLEATAGAPYAVLERPSGALFKVFSGDRFGTSPDAPERYQVIDIRPNAVVIEDSAELDVITLDRIKR